MIFSPQSVDSITLSSQLKFHLELDSNCANYHQCFDVLYMQLKHQCVSLEYGSRFTGLAILHGGINYTYTADIFKVAILVAILAVLGCSICMQGTPLNLVLAGQTLVTRQTEKPVVPLGRFAY